MTQIDIHGMTQRQAREYLKKELSSLPKGTPCVNVIHGYNSGTKLKDMVKTFKHERIKRIEVGLNPGETTLYLKD